MWNLNKLNSYSLIWSLLFILSALHCIFKINNWWNLIKATRFSYQTNVIYDIFFNQKLRKPAWNKEHIIIKLLLLNQNAISFWKKTKCSSCRWLLWPFSFPWPTLFFLWQPVIPNLEWWPKSLLRISPVSVCYFPVELRISVCRL